MTIAGWQYLIILLHDHICEYVYDTNNAHNWYLVDYNFKLQDKQLLQVLFINTTLLRLLFSWGAAFICETFVLSCKPVLSESLMGMFSKMRGHLWVICHLRMDICPKRGKKWGIGCLKPPMFILQNNHKWANFCSGAMLYTLFFDGVQIGNLKSLFRVVKIYEPQHVNLQSNNVQLDLQRLTVVQYQHCVALYGSVCNMMWYICLENKTKIKIFILTNDE